MHKKSKTPMDNIKLNKENLEKSKHMICAKLTKNGGGGTIFVQLDKISCV